MTTNTICSTAIAVMLFASLCSSASSVEKETNEFAITPVENLHLGKSVEKVWTISYSEQDKPVTIALRKVANGKEYVVRSMFFEVIYASNKDGFGVKKIHSSLKEVPVKINASVLNKQQMQNQKILTPNKVSEAYALDLIASYLPDLLNGGYKHLLY